MNAVTPVTAQGARIRSGDEWWIWRRGDETSRPWFLASFKRKAATASSLTNSPAWHIVSASVVLGAAVYGLCLFSISTDMRRPAVELLANRRSWFRQ